MFVILFAHDGHLLDQSLLLDLLLLLLLLLLVRIVWILNGVNADRVGRNAGSVGSHNAQLLAALSELLVN